MINKFQKTQNAGRRTHDARGFSLMEVLLAVGTLAMGMLFIAGVFPVSIYFTTVSTERTIAATVADEAFAKIKLYGIYDPNVVYNAQTLYENTLPPPGLIPAYEFAYPSNPIDDYTTKKYWWSAICRRLNINDVQVTVFICRKAGVGTTYPSNFNPLIYPPSRPVAMPLEVTTTAVGDELRITGITGNKSYVNDGSTIVDDETGQIYRVLKRYLPPNDSVIRLEKNWQGGILPGLVWVIPPPIGTGRYPCIAVYQKVMRF